MPSFFPHVSLVPPLATLHGATPSAPPCPYDAIMEAPCLTTANPLLSSRKVVDAATTELKWSDPDVEGLKKFLVEEKQFAEERVNKAIERLHKCKGKGNQGRLESFFGATTTHSSTFKKPVPAKGKGKAKGKALSGPAAKKQKR